MFTPFIPDVEDVEFSDCSGDSITSTQRSFPTESKEFGDRIEKWLNMFQDQLDAHNPFDGGKRINIKIRKMPNPNDWFYCIPDVLFVQASLRNEFIINDVTGLLPQDPKRSVAKQSKKYENEFGNFKRAVVHAVGYGLVCVDDLKSLGGLMSAMDQKWDDLTRHLIERYVPSTLKTTLAHCEGIWQR